MYEENWRVWGMHDGGWGFWGMHLFGWLLWVALIAGLVYALVTATRRQRETPVELLQRRYAAGEISTEEYEERKAVLERDAAGGG
jgi:putative membrane protein